MEEGRGREKGGQERERQIEGEKENAFRKCDLATTT